MKAVRNWLDKQKPNFEKGGKLHMFKSVFGGFETFMFVPRHTSKKGSHVRDYIDLKRTMSIVVTALIPCLLFGMYNVGYQHFNAIGQADAAFMDIFLYGLIAVLPVVVVAYASGLAVEFAVAQMRGHEIQEGFLVSGMLIPLVMPVETPLWMVAVATIFSVVFVKEVFGGTGMNIWNPALVARAFLFFAYPTKMSGESVWVRLGQEVEGFSGATPMAIAASTVDSGENVVSQLAKESMSLADMFLGFIPGSIGETSTLAILIGAAILIYTGIGSWKIMLSTVLGATAVGLLFNAAGANPYMELPFYYHFVMGGFAFGAVFMATDPVSAAQTNQGKWIYGFLIGALAVIIRVVNPAYPEGMMLAILLANTFAPLIDHYVVEANISKRLKRVKA